MTLTWLLWLLNAMVFLGWFVRSFQVWRYARTALRLPQVPESGPGPLPRLSVNVAALNEEATVERAMRTLLAADYPDLEILAVNDRSTDRTGAILETLAAVDPRLRVAHVRELPPGWVGKNHALHVGAQRASGEYLLFTDADVHFHPTALRRAVRTALDRELDHLVLLPEIVLDGFWEKLLITFFGTAFLFWFQPWKVSRPRSTAYLGVGAFNLVRAEAYRRAGGHAALPMDIIDDLKLGKRMKESGARASCGFSGALVRVRWAEGLRGIIAGISKNSFAGFAFRPLGAVAGVGALLLMAAWPAAGLFVGPWGARLLCAGALACMVWTARAAPPAPAISPLVGLGYPVAAFVFAYAILRSMAATLRQQGVVWRGTFYPLVDLRKGVT